MAVVVIVEFHSIYGFLTHVLNVVLLSTRYNCILYIYSPVILTKYYFFISSVQQYSVPTVTYLKLIIQKHSGLAMAIVLKGCGGRIRAPTA